MTRTGYGETFFIKKLANLKYIAHVAPPVHTLSGAALDRLQLGELGFPEAQHVRRQMAEASDLPDAEIEFVGDHNVAALFPFPGGFLVLCVHHSPQRSAKFLTSLAHPQFQINSTITCVFEMRIASPVMRPNTEKPPQRCFSVEAAILLTHLFSVSFSS
jgi:hypothetical protein